MKKYVEKLRLNYKNKQQLLCYNKMIENVFVYVS